MTQVTIGFASETLQNGESNTIPREFKFRFQCSNSPNKHPNNKRQQAQHSQQGMSAPSGIAAIPTEEIDGQPKG